MMRNNESLVHCSTYTIYSQTTYTVNSDGSFLHFDAMFFSVLRSFDFELIWTRSLRDFVFQESLDFNMVHNGIFPPEKWIPHRICLENALKNRRFWIIRPKGPFEPFSHQTNWKSENSFWNSILLMNSHSTLVCVLIRMKWQTHRHQTPTPEI